MRNQIAITNYLRSRGFIKTEQKYRHECGLTVIISDEEWIASREDETESGTLSDWGMLVRLVESTLKAT